MEHYIDKIYIREHNLLDLLTIEYDFLVAK